MPKNPANNVLNQLMDDLVQQTSQSIAANLRPQMMVLGSLIGTESAAAVIIKANYIALSAMAGAAFGDIKLDADTGETEPSEKDEKFMKELGKIGQQYLEHCLEHLKERRDELTRRN